MIRIEEISWLYFLIFVPMILGVIYYYANYRVKVLDQLGWDLGDFIDNKVLTRQKLLLSLFCVGISLIIISLINPQYGTKREAIASKSADVVIMLDVSTSMLAEDINPNRLERAKIFGNQLIEGLKGHRIGLVYFAGGSFIQMPLSNDIAAAKAFVSTASVNQILTQGTNIEEGLMKVQDVVKEDDKSTKVMVIITDVENHEEDPIPTLQQMAEQGWICYVVGVGTSAGSPIPLQTKDGKTFKKDESGSIIMTKVDEALLSNIAAAGQGKAYMIDQSATAIKGITAAVNKVAKNDVSQLSFSEYNDYYRWFLLPGVLLLAFTFLRYENPSIQLKKLKSTQDE